MADCELCQIVKAQRFSRPTEVQSVDSCLPGIGQDHYVCFWLYGHKIEDGIGISAAVELYSL